MKVAFVTPCYNEVDGIAELLRRCSAVLQESGHDYEIVLVDDGSSDGTWQKIAAEAAADSRVRGVRLSRNFGHQLAISAGLSVASGDRVLVLDADLQDPPELLPRMMQAMDDGCDVVYGRRTRREGVELWKKAGYFVFYRILRFMGGELVQVDAGDFRLMSRRVVDLLVAMPERQRFLRGMVSWLGFRQEAVEYDRDPRFEGEAKYTLGKLIRLAMDGIMSFSVQPLRLASFFGAFFGVCGLAGGGYVVAATWVSGRSPQGWASLMVVVLIMGAVQLLMVGIIGEYLGKLFLEGKGRPAFIIAEISGKESPVRQ